MKSIRSTFLLNYLSLHYCHSFPPPLLLLHFLLLSLSACSTSDSSPASSPSAAVTLLSLGNGAPDVFASIAALLSVGAFVSAFVGLVAILSGPFQLDLPPFLRDVFFYFLAASGLFYVYLSGGDIFVTAVGFVWVLHVFCRVSVLDGFGGRGGGGGGGKRKGMVELRYDEGGAVVIVNFFFFIFQITVAAGFKGRIYIYIYIYIYILEIISYLADT